MWKMPKLVHKRQLHGLESQGKGGKSERRPSCDSELLH
jgi:hypothetical protein